MKMSFHDQWNSAISLNQWRRNYTNSKKRVMNPAVPFAGTKSILFSFQHWGLTEDSIHNTSLLFLESDILTEDPHDPNYITTNYKGIDYYFRKLDFNAQPVLTRCSCSDYYYVWAYANLKKGVLFGPAPRPYRRVVPPSNKPPRNPSLIPGVCKHIVNSALIMQTSGWALKKNEQLIPVPKKPLPNLNNIMDTNVENDNEQI